MLTCSACAPHFNRDPANDHNGAANENANELLEFINKFTAHTLIKNGEEGTNDVQDILREMSPMDEELDEKSPGELQAEKSPSKARGKRTASQAEIIPLRVS